MSFYITALIRLNYGIHSVYILLCVFKVFSGSMYINRVIQLKIVAHDVHGANLSPDH